MSIFPHDISNLLTGPVRVLHAPYTTARPTNIEDIIAMVDPYAPKAGWVDLGATNDETEYSRDMESEELFIEQSTSSVLERITENTRQLTVPMAEFTDATTKIAEEGVGPTTIAAAANKGAQKAIDVGSIEALTRYRVAFIAMRDPGFGDTVIEPGGATRGPFVAFAGYNAAIAAEESSFSLSKEDLSGRELVFGFFPDSAVADPRVNTGRFLFEEPGTIV
jgi:hypothetical protein